MKAKGRRVAITMGAAALTVAGLAVARLELVPFEHRYDVADILSKVREAPGPESNSQALAELIAEGCGGEDSIQVRAAEGTVIVKGRFDQHVQVWRCLRLLRSP